MHPQLFPISFMFVAIVALIPASLAQGNEQYLNCSQLFQCGNIQGIGYPFWGANRSQSCGHPSFFLNCTGEAPVLTIQTRPYRVLSIDNATYALTVVRQEFWNDTCPQYLYNATLDPDHFNYAADTDELVLRYGCTTLVPGNTTIANQFPCLANGTEGTFGIFASAGLTTMLNFTTVSCNTSVSVLVNSTVGAGLSSNGTSAKLTEVLESGVGLVWEANNTNCQRCVGSGGACGSNSSNPGSLVCYCSDGEYDASCGSSQPGTESKRNLGKKLGIGIGSVLVVGVVTTLALFYYFGRNSSGKSFIFWNNENEVHANLEAILNNCGSLAPKKYSYSEVKKMTNSFKEKLGQGGYGLVYKGKLKNGSLIAVKVLKESKGNGEEFINEVTSISRTAHINVVTLLGFCFERRKRALIYEFMPNGSLDKFISDKNLSVEHQLGWGTLYQIAIGIARGLEYLHRGCNTRILHFDIKPHNILLDEGFCPKISDFGLAKLCPKKNSIISMSDTRGTAGYIAPEVFSRIYGGVSHKSDVYSYGMMIIDMVGGRKNVDLGVDHTTEYFPDWLYRHLELAEEIGQHGNINEAETEISRKMTTVGLWCIQTDPSSRPAMSKVVEMLEGSLASLRIPPRPFLASLQRAPAESSSTDNLESCSSNV
ncbi:LEAF RUST 10 DISEASE-RESISTANCE LOCUS RECEPTOR-LIKE PROTEIN KINASE-like 2.1 [Rhododendron vialii]|uniref:LEAF RUST 10 DISEASE-RESISTANCE LOCUS RECEPTOR-LIKE PROTEIN KINASE-like 2.1 n=1 Tax=Rhododendron vialii TaxID=182163 RepID=UPI0026605163|nr:LEAF RUST 10 DISEASE-RESISTANCE LOCUS RECEPTOR-LIKE PROTEIN KINASE-like 2.1 [Rhododendron vialii]